MARPGPSGPAAPTPPAAHPQRARLHELALEVVDLLEALVHLRDLHRQRRAVALLLACGGARARQPGAAGVFEGAEKCRGRHSEDTLYASI